MTDIESRPRHLVIGGGFGGMLAGAALTSKGFGVTVVERGSDAPGPDGVLYRNGLPQEGIPGSPSQGNLRGSHTAEQPSGLRTAVEVQWDFVKQVLQPTISEPILTDTTAFAPYLMIVEDSYYWDLIKELITHKEPYISPTPAAAAKQYNISLPQGYAVINTESAELIKADYLMQACQTLIRNAGGVIKFETEVIDYAALQDGTYRMPAKSLRKEDFAQVSNKVADVPVVFPDLGRKWHQARERRRAEDIVL